MVQRWLLAAVHWWRCVLEWSDRSIVPPVEWIESTIGFEMAAGAVILVNSYLLAVSADYELSNLSDSGPPGYDVLESIFVAIYTTELLIRLAARRLRFFGSPWGWLDVLVVLGGWLEVFNNGGPSDDISQFRITRILKTVKVARVARVMRSMKGARMLMDSLIGSARPLFWTSVVIAAITFMFGMVFVKTVASFLTSEAETGYQGP